MSSYHPVAYALQDMALCKEETRDWPELASQCVASRIFAGWLELAAWPTVKTL